MDRTFALVNDEVLVDYTGEGVEGARCRHDSPQWEERSTGVHQHRSFAQMDALLNSTAA